MDRNFDDTARASLATPTPPPQPACSLLSRNILSLPIAAPGPSNCLQAGVTTNSVPLHFPPPRVWEILPFQETHTQGNQLIPSSEKRKKSSTMVREKNWHCRMRFVTGFAAPVPPLRRRRRIRRTRRGGATGPCARRGRRLRARGGGRGFRWSRREWTHIK